MRFSKLTIISLCILLTMMNGVYAKLNSPNRSAAIQNGIMSVPFQNVGMFPNHVISATFSFGNHTTIFCFENTLQTIGIITWPFQGKIFQSQLPIFLKTSANVPGSFSDSSGTLTIRNDTKLTLIVSCVFGY